jgi:hypothetical protein
MTNTTATLEALSLYDVCWEEPSGKKGKWGKTQVMTKTEIDEYVQHLNFDEEWFHDNYETDDDDEKMTFTYKLSDDQTQTIPATKEIEWEDEETAEWARLDDIVDDYLGYNVIQVFGFLDRSKVNFSMWTQLWEEHEDELDDVTDIFDLEAINENCYIKAEGWFGKHVFYTNPIDKPTWFQVAMAAELAIRESGDIDHRFVEFIFKTDEIKDGLPVYQIHFGS